MIQRIAYRFFGDFCGKIKFPSLEQKIRQSRLFIPISMYLSLFFFSIFLAAAVSLFLIFILYLFYLLEIIEKSTLCALLFSVAVSFVGIFCLIFIAFLLFPELRAYDRKIKIEKQLPFAVNYMSAMAAAGVQSDVIFKTMASNRFISIYRALSEEFTQFIVQTDFFGQDYPSALTVLADETSSSLFSNFMTGAKNTFLSGSRFQNFIVSKKHEYQSLAARRKERYFQTLELISEMYITAFLAAPLFMTILLFSMMPFSGSKIEQMKLLAYQAVPFLGVFFLLILEIINEKEDV
jgi:hypothetical protein